MPTLLLVNRVDELVPRMTTSLLLEAALRRGLDARVCALAGLWLAADGRPMAAAIRPPTPPAARDDEPARARWLAALGATPAEPLAIGPADRLWIRTNPACDTGRAAQHRLALDLAALAAERGTAWPTRRPA
ncbi:MAG: hypothetical protein H6648_11545 [Caldilineae bacterium]|nr:hypothetical protein [Caldilineae bacterium]